MLILAPARAPLPSPNKWRFKWPTMYLHYGRCRVLLVVMICHDSIRVLKETLARCTPRLFYLFIYFHCFVHYVTYGRGFKYTLLTHVTLLCKAERPNTLYSSSFHAALFLPYFCCVQPHAVVGIAKCPAHV